MKSAKKRIHDTHLSRIMIARILFYVNAALWLVVGVFFIGSMIEDNNGWITGMVAFFFLMSILSLIIAARILDQPEKEIFIVLIIITVLNILLSFVGYPDFIYIILTLIDLVILFNLIPLKSYYVK
jgi:hypothetical protein